ncbi:unnamed protein product [Rotaria socialis]|uniref:TANC1/2-like winged helix domain-containing protein n=2 Tax=Rotaria socialis TaxID=392032 RepID=A0A817LRI4_9BILA|nr:unnamed protein product [Rotaria socialis]CAF3363783.1 unnamed protein product [Rotaria socialis]CAF3675114.1 unnamed protein product [Rotaria socialis]CAF4118089.1 unnamed protein product [Rotaria socialis]CAF4179363.1 unnamed protein product [Rotaria socialis]
MRSMPPSPIPTPNSQPHSSSTIIANNLLVQASPPMPRSSIERPPPTPVKPVSHFQKLLHHFNGSKSFSSSFIRGTPLTSSQQRSAIKTNGSMTTIIKNSNNKTPEQLISKPKSDETLPPPPPPEMAHEQLLDILFQSNRTHIASISPSPSTSSATTHTSIQQIMRNNKKKQPQQQIQFNPTNISPSMSNSDLSFSPSGMKVFSPSIETFSGYELGPMSKSAPNAMVESQTWSPPRYITTPSSSSASTHTCHCSSNLKDDSNSLHDDEKLFIQRDWIYDEMFKLIRGTTKPGLVLISRTPGMGKTWLMKNLLRITTSASQQTTSVITQNEKASIIRVNSAKKSSYEWLKCHILSSHFCDCSQTDSCSLPDIIHSIIYRALEHPLLHAYRDVILREQHTRKAITLNACIQNVEHAFFTAFLDQLNQLKLLGHLQELFSVTNHIYLIIDGINNELCDTEGQTITEFLFTNLHRIPPWLKLIITMNRLHDNQLQTEQNTFLQHFAVLDIEDELRFSNYLYNDIRKYLSKRLENDCSNELYDLSSSMSNIDQLCTLSHGNIFFIQQLCDLFEQREFPANIDLPRTLNEIYYYRFRTNKIQEHIEICRAILEICLAIRRPINLNVLYSCVNVDEESHIEWSIFLQCVSYLSAFLTQYPNATYATVHGSIRHWLLTNKNQYFACNIKKGHSRLALYLSHSLSNSLHGPEATECIRHLSLSDLFSNNIIQLCHTIKHLIDDPSRLLASLRNAFYPELDISELLLMTSANPDSIVNSIHMPLLCIASRNGYMSFVELLLKYHANVNIITKDNDNKTSLMLAAEYGHEQVVKLLINYNANITLKDKYQLTAVAYATKHVSILKLLNCTDESIKQQAFVYAASTGSLDALEFMLTDNHYSTIDINGTDYVHGETALTNAASHGHMNVIDYLITNHQADIDRTNSRQMTPLLLAVKNGMWSCVEYLLDHHASIEHCDKQKRTCLVIASSEGHLAVIDSLLEKGANVHHEDEEGLTSLSWACLKGHFHACETLLAHGSNINHEDINGRIPIDMASFYGDVQLVQLLIDHGSIVDHVDKNGMRALDRAIGCRNVAVVNCLLKKSVKLGPSTWALAAGKNDMMTILISKLIDDGISLYKKNQYKDAAYRFSYALKKLPTNIDQQTTDQFTTNFRFMKYNCLIHLAKCKRKLDSYEAAIDYCTQALYIHNTADGLLLRSRIKRDQKLYDDALTDLLAAKNLDPTNTDLDRYINRLNVDLQHCHETLL